MPINESMREYPKFNELLFDDRVSVLRNNEVTYIQNNTAREKSVSKVTSNGTSNGSSRVSVAIWIFHG